MTELIIHDRYSATGTPRPNPKTMCHECEGMGCYPVKKDTKIEADKKLWIEADKKRRCAKGFFKSLWDNRKWWFWRQAIGDLFRYGIRNWGCDDWHFVTCPACKGTRLKPTDISKGDNNERR